jgi:TonB-linked SusC/RagA family outer membrane protein
MARVLTVCALTLGVAQAVAAQQRGTIAGQVVHTGGVPAVGAQVFVVGTSIGAISNREGRFTLPNVPAGPRVLRVQLIGYADAEQTVTVPGAGSVPVRFELKEQAVSIPSVVVTAMGIQRKEKSLGYAAQGVNQLAIERSPEVNLINTLASQTAGVQVTKASGQPGSSSRITIRGESSFQGDGQPLFVIDGIPITIQQDASMRNNPLEFGEMGSRAMDLDPNSIEEMTVLRGAAATALYGSRGAFGVVVIKTKRGRPGQPVQFSLSTSMTADRPILGGKQTRYAQGMDGYFCNGRLREQGGWCQPGYPGTNPNPVSNNSWGPHRDSIPQIVLDSMGELRFRDARKDFYETGRTLVNSLNMTGSMPLGTFSFNVARTDQSGIFPGTMLDRTSLTANVTANLSSSLQSMTSVQYINSDNQTATEGYSSLTRTLFQLPITRDIQQSRMPDGTPVMLGNNSPHPVWLSQNEGNRSTTGRWIASQQLALMLFPGVILSNQIGVDTYVDERLYFQNERPWQTLVGANSGGTDQEKISRRELTNNMRLSFDGFRFADGAVTVSGVLGNEISASDQGALRASGDNILVPGNYNVDNFSTNNIQGTLSVKERLVGVYGEITADFRDYAFLTLTGRNDWSSTLPVKNNSYFYPSVSLAVVFTDALNISNRFLDYGKVRVSRAKVGNDAPRYRIDTRYSTAGAGGPNLAQQQNACCGLSFPIPQQNGVPGYIQSNQLGNPELRPESTVETEVGLELRLFGSRLTTDISWYHKNSYDQIFNVPSSAVTGYTSITRNAGNLTNKGLEVTVRGTPIDTDAFTWDLIANWSRNKSAVVSLAPGVTSLFLAGYSWPQIRIMEGYEYGIIWGYGYRHNEKGELLIGDDGFPILDDQLKSLGETQHDWEGSLNTEIRYKSFGLTGLIDTKQGGQMLNFELQYTIPPGQAKITENRGDLYTFKGVNATTGQPNTVKLERNRQFWQRYGQFDLHENMLEPADAVRLREATLYFRLPPQLLSRIGAQSARIYVTGQNLKVWTPNTKGDPEGSNYGSANAGGSSYSFFQAPQTRSWVFGVRTTF